MVEKRINISISYLILSYFKVTNNEYIDEQDYKKLQKEVCNIIENSSLKRKYNLVLSEDDNLKNFAKSNTKMFDCDELQKTLYIKNDIKTKTEIKRFRVDQNIERIIKKYFNKENNIKTDNGSKSTLIHV